MGGRVQLALMGAALSVLIAPTVRAEEVGNGVGAWERGSVDEWMS
jgi:hypothetical protein